MKAELEHREAERKNERATIKRMFDVDRAWAKLHRAYDGLNASEPL